MNNRIIGALTGIILLLGLAPAAPPALAGSFSDVPAGDPNYTAIESLKELGIIKGYADGTFRPLQVVNRAEALKLIMSGAGTAVPKGLYATGFSDVGIGEWYSGYIMYGVMRGIITGNPDGTFAPSRGVNKAEFLKMILKAFNTDLSAYQNLSSSISPDSKISDWFTPYLAYAKSAGLVSPALSGSLGPSISLNRSGCAEILYKMYVLKNGAATQKLLTLSEAKLIDSIVRINDNDLESAARFANEAVFFSSIALNNEPDSSVTRAAGKIAQSFQKLYAAYQAGYEKRTQDLQALVSEAKAYAVQAAQINASIQLLAGKINYLGDHLLFQAAQS